MSEINLIMKYLGIPYKHQGRTLEGFDCWGWILFIYKILRNIELWDIEGDYPEEWWLEANSFFENYQKKWERINKPQILDVVLINSERGVAIHAGIMIDKIRFIHCCKAGVVMNKVTEKIWKNRIAGYFRYKNDKN